MEHKTYLEYKDSGIEWLGQVPADWQVRRLGSFISNSNAGEVIDRTHWHEGKELLYTCSKEPMKSSYGHFPDKKRTQVNDLLLTRNATPYVHIPKEGAIYSNVVQRVSIDTFYDRRWLAYAISAPQSNMIGYGVSIPSLNFPMWRKLMIPTPSSTVEQQQIVTFLDTETAHIDAGIANMESLIALLTEKRSALISEVVTRGIPGEHDEFKDSGVAWLGEIPDTWSRRSLGSLADWINGFGFKPEHLNGTKYNVVRIKEMLNSDSSMDKTDLEVPEKYLLKDGDLVYSWSMTLATHMWNRGEALLNQHLYRVISNDLTSNSWLRYSLDAAYPELVNLMHGSAAKHITRKNLLAFQIPLPPLGVQQKIVRFLDKETSQIDLAIDNAKSVIQLMKEKRQTLISDVVTGKIDVRNSAN